jgi:PmbA protein
MRGLKEADAEQLADDIVETTMRKGASAAQAQSAITRYFEIDFNHRGVDVVRTTETEVTTITVYRHGKRASSMMNGGAPAEIETAIAAALIAADAGIADPANDIADAISLVPSNHGPAEGDRRKMISSVEEFIADLAARYPLVRTRNSLYHFTDVETVFVNSRGLRQKERRARYGFGAMFMAKDGLKTTSFNYSGASAFAPFKTLFHVGSVARLLDETVKSLDRRPVAKKFIGDAIMTPDCVATFISPLAEALSGAALFACTTPYHHGKGEAIASPRFSLSNRPRAPEFPDGADFDGYGIPTKDLDVVKDGVLNEFLIDFFFSKKLGVPQTAGASNFAVATGDESLDEMIAKTKRGILLSRFSGGMPNNNLDFSGLAKNSFYIEDGRIKHAVDETMVSGNLRELLHNIHAVSRESVNFGGGSFPFVAASGVTISSK